MFTGTLNLCLSCLENIYGFPGGSNGKESACIAGDSSSIPRSGRSLEKGMAAHSSILAWRIPWTEEPGGLQSLGSQLVTTERLTHVNDNRKEL